MGKAVRVPDPVYERLSAVAEREDVSRGAVLREWMKRADQSEVRTQEPTPIPSDSFEGKFWQKVNVKGPDECWEWGLSTTDAGYGQVTIDGEFRYSHRLAVELSGVELGDGFVLHSCHNPPCCNPAHLRVGTQSDNMDDAAVEGTLSGRPQGFSDGEENPNSKLTVDQAAAIKRRVATGDETQKEIAKDFGVDPSTVYQIKAGKIWKSA